MVKEKKTMDRGYIYTHLDTSESDQLHDLTFTQRLNTEFVCLEADLRTFMFAHTDFVTHFWWIL